MFGFLLGGKAVYYVYVAGDACCCVIGIINFVDRYGVYGKLEKGKITIIEAGIGEVTGQKQRLIRSRAEKKALRSGILLK